jgi:hypothetical protein
MIRPADPGDSQRSTLEGRMTPYHAYQVLEAERVKADAARRATDVRLGEAAAALAGMYQKLPSLPLISLGGGSSRCHRRRPADGTAAPPGPRTPRLGR